MKLNGNKFIHIENIMSGIEIITYTKKELETLKHFGYVEGVNMGIMDKKETLEAIETMIENDTQFEIIGE